MPTSGFSFMGEIGPVSAGIRKTSEPKAVGHCPGCIRIVRLDNRALGSVV